MNERESLLVLMDKAYERKYDYLNGMPSQIPELCVFT